MKYLAELWQGKLTLLGAILTTIILAGGGVAWAQSKGDKVFHAVVTDAQGVETDVKNIQSYWEERVSETAFVPHELKQVPVKRGTATVNVRFETIKQIDVKPGQDKLPILSITLSNGKAGEFALALPGSFKGESDFGEVELPAHTLRKILFK